MSSLPGPSLGSLKDQSETFPTAGHGSGMFLPVQRLRLNSGDKRCRHKGESRPTTGDLMLGTMGEGLGQAPRGKGLQKVLLGTRDRPQEGT